MKKRILSLFLLLIVFCLMACQQSELPPSSDPQIFYYRDLFATNPIDDELVDWNDEDDMYQDKEAFKTREISFLGHSYATRYICSYEFGLADIKLHMYLSNDSHSIVFALNASTGKIVGIAGMPYSHTATNESQYKAECVKILGTHYSKTYTCQYRSTTKYVTADSQGNITEHSIKDFYTPTEADQIIEREFYFEKYIDGIKTYEQYYISFNEKDQTIVVKIYDCDYERNIFDKRSSIDMESVIDEYLATHKKTNTELGGYHWNETMFVKGGIPYSAIRVYFDSGDGVELLVKH
ncbi:MAG: hypothetical protein IJW29_02860 [Clostridia bacterium]|nr:hypothetical protein [Clostridia bacterium]